MDNHPRKRLCVLDITPRRRNSLSLIPPYVHPHLFIQIMSWIPAAHHFNLLGQASSCHRERAQLSRCLKTQRHLYHSLYRHGPHRLFSTTSFPPYSLPAQPHTTALPRPIVGQHLEACSYIARWIPSAAGCVGEGHTPWSLGRGQALIRLRFSWWQSRPLHAFAATRHFRCQAATGLRSCASGSCRLIDVVIAVTTVIDCDGVLLDSSGVVEARAIA